MNSPLPPRRRALALLGAVALASLLGTGLPGPATAAPAQDLETAFADFGQARAGDTTALERAAERFRTLSAADPADPMLRAYAGTTHSMLARTTLLPWRKMSFAEDGLADVDKALAMLTPAHDQPGFRGAPTSLETRLVASGTFLAMPSMFNRRERGLKLLQDVTTSPLLPPAPLGFRAAVWLIQAEQAQRDGQRDAARKLLQQVVDSGAPQAAAAQDQLKALQ